MPLQIKTKSFSNPVCTNGGQDVIENFMCMYGVEKRKGI